MPDKNLNLSITLQEINEVLCPKCKAKLLEITKDKISEVLAKNVLEGKHAK